MHIAGCGLNPSLTKLGMDLSRGGKKGYSTSLRLSLQETGHMSKSCVARFIISVSRQAGFLVGVLLTTFDRPSWTKLLAVLNSKWLDTTPYLLAPS